MKVIAVYLIGRPSNGGSYQYWMAVLKALTQINQDKYQVIVYSPYEDWGDNSRGTRLDLFCS